MSHYLDVSKPRNAVRLVLAALVVCGVLAWVWVAYSPSPPYQPRLGIYQTGHEQGTYGNGLGVRVP